jgi:hypothetical protein
MIAAFAFVVDMWTLIQDNGKQIDWSVVNNSYRRGTFKVKLAEAVSIGETGITVDALLHPLEIGSRILFATYEPVVVTVGAAGASAGATSVPVDALSGPIPAGQVVHLGTNKFVVLSAAAAAGATSLATLAIPTALVDNDTGTWRGGDAELVLAAAALEGATSITVESPNFELADDAEGDVVLVDDYMDSSKKFIPAGTVMSELSNRKLVPRASRPGSEAATCVLLTDAIEDSRTDSETGYGVTYGGIMKENLMPDADPTTGLLPTDYKTELSIRFVWRRDYDSRGN